MKLSEFNYTIPKKLIAKYPADPRDSSYMMVLDRKTGEMIFGRAFQLAGWREVGFTGSGLITLAKDFIPLGAQWPWHPKRRKNRRPPYWPLEKQIESLPPWAGGTPEYIHRSDKEIVDRALEVAAQTVTFYGSEREPEPI